MEEKVAMLSVPDKVFANEIAEVMSKVKDIVVVDTATYETAGNALVYVKSTQKKVIDWFAPLKDAAYKSHKALTTRESETLVPLNDAEKKIKNAMSDYSMAQERIRREKEAEIRRQQEEEKRRAFEEAQKLEQEGKTEEAEQALTAAIEAEDMAQFIHVEMPKPEVKGISTQTDWEVSITDETKVPDYLMGICVRPVDLGAIKRLVKASQGKIKIEGISVRETMSMRARG
jgi:hypothetical protein